MQKKARRKKIAFAAEVAQCHVCLKLKLGMLFNIGFVDPQKEPGELYQALGNRKPGDQIRTAFHKQSDCPFKAAASMGVSQGKLLPADKVESSLRTLLETS